MNRILVIHRGSLGDFLLLVPALSALRERFPEARFEALGRVEILSLACPGILDSTASIERSTLLPFFEESAQLPDAEAQYFTSFDTVLAYLSDPAKNFERNLTRLGTRNLVVRPPFPPAGERTHVGKYLFDTLAPLLGPEPGRAVGPPPFLCFTDDEMQEAETLLQPARSKGQPIVAIHPGSGSEAKCWPPERFEALTRRLKGAGHAIALILGPADERLVERMSTVAEGIGAVIAHNLPLRLLAAVLSRCDAYVGNDSGVTHLAAATGIPTLAIFGPTDPAVWAPLGKNIRVITNNTDCSPCARETMRECDNPLCLEALGEELVTGALREMDVLGR